MDYGEMLAVVKALKFDKPKTVLTQKDFSVYLLRPSKVPKRLQNNYNRKKNFQVWLKHAAGREFRPNHLRVFLDLNLRIRCRPDLRKALCLAFDKIFIGVDPEKAVKQLAKEQFELHLNDIQLIAVLAQLFIIEQDYNYQRASKFDPPTLFFHGWARQMLDSPKEIDNLCMSVCNRQPPATKYTYKDNKKHKKFDPKAEPLWYLDE